MLLRLRIPHWSRLTTVKVNGEDIRDVKPATYLDLSRSWKLGDRIELQLDLSPQIWTGEGRCAGRVSLYRGPVLLTYDPRFNPGKPVDPAPINLSEITLSLASWKGSQAPILLAEATTAGGTINLCDFASAGFDGSSYHSWLRADHTTSFPYSREHPWRSQPSKFER